MLQNFTVCMLFSLLRVHDFSLTKEKIAFFVLGQELLTQTWQMVAHSGEAIVSEEFGDKLRLAAESDNQGHTNADAGLLLECCLSHSFI